ncbi:NAD(P)-binding protein [Punctularia strigosozonata HHB-11173 SS5]|uniref:NAD(P)-binding protein n=1 Tax=Punctularia strigosozonata (strain HHB-11173) TaxID=741275 RepID=UPI0004417C29|nr:NAD(P)-binding protein [Punctularia strigosozonata HHB-11173 SS5]EIN10590.1 NAD(P)-binding protein [Punctularia strigosozonata HHB-11173 SS5]
MSQPIKTCVLGVGLAGLTFHVPFILALPDLFVLSAVLERNPSTPGGKLQQRFGVTARIHKTLDAVLEDPEIELVIVGTPNETHYEFAKRCLLAGKHVLVDKPVTATVEQAKELGELAKSKNLVLYGFQNRRWDSDFMTLRKLLSLPESSPQSLGKLVEFESRFDRYRTGLKGTWKDMPLPASGLTYDLGSHLLDQTLVLFGRPEKITAFIQNVRGLGHEDVDDCFTIFLHYQKSAKLPYGLTVILRAHILSAKSKQLRYVVRGTKGTYTKYGVDPQEDTLRAISSPASVLSDAQYGVEPENIWGDLETVREDGSFDKAMCVLGFLGPSGFLLLTYSLSWPSTEQGQYAGLYKNLAGAIRHDEEMAVKWAESTAVIEMIELAHQSAKEGRTIAVPSL